MPSLTTPTLDWRELYYPRPMEAPSAVEAVRRLAEDPRSPLITLEARGSNGSVRFLTGCPEDAVTRVTAALGAVAVGLSVPRLPVTTARRLTLSTRHRALDAEALDVSAPAILAALAACRAGEELVLQVLLGPRLSGLVVPTTVRQPVPLARLLVGYPKSNPEGRMDAEARKALAQKVCEPGFCAVVRVGVVARTPSRRQTLVLGLLGALRRLQNPGVAIWLTGERPERLDQAKTPWRWSIRLNVAEVAAVAGLPVGEGLPGLPLLHPVPKAPVVLARPSGARVIVAQATAPGLPEGSYLTRSTEALVRHTHVIGPTGVGKSVLLANMALADIDAGRGVVIIEPKGDLVRDVLAALPPHRRDDVVVLDPSSDSGIVGLNPLSGSGSPELKADAVLSVFTDLFGEALGPRSTDILHSALLTLARSPNASLVQIPRLLSDQAFRAHLVSAVADDPGLGPFWVWYESLGEAERASVVAPLMNKLRAVLLRPTVRSVLGQVRPRFDIRQVFRSSKILLVPLPVATLGAEGSALLGSLVVAQLWDAARERAMVDPRARRPVSIILDECQQFMRLPLDLTDALATSRSYGVGWTLAHQYFAQLPPALRSAVLSNVRSRIAFQTSRDDAKVLAAETHGDLEPEDFASLPAFQVYASLLEHGTLQPYASGRTLPPPQPTGDPDERRRASAQRYGRSREEIEAEFVSAVIPTVTPPARTQVLPDVETETRQQDAGSLQLVRASAGASGTTALPHAQASTSPAGGAGTRSRRTSSSISGRSSTRTSGRVDGNQPSIEANRHPDAEIPHESLPSGTDMSSSNGREEVSW